MQDFSSHVNGILNVAERDHQTLKIWVIWQQESNLVRGNVSAPHCDTSSWPILVMAEIHRLKAIVGVAAAGLGSPIRIATTAHEGVNFCAGEILGRSGWL